MESSSLNSSTTLSDDLPFLGHGMKNDKILQPIIIDKKLQFKQVWVLEEPKFIEKVKQYSKYEVKQYEVTMLIQEIINEVHIDFMNENKLKEMFQTLLLQLYSDPKPLRINKLTIETDIYPYQVELIVDFVTKIGQDPFHKIDLQPINYTLKDTQNGNNPKYLIDYFMTIKQLTCRFPEDFIVLAQLGKGSFGYVNLVKYRRDNKIYALKILNKLSEKEMKAFLKFDDKNYGSNNNIIREILFMKNLRDVHKIKHPNIVNLEHFWVQKETDGNYRLCLQMSYFGGTNISNNCIFDFFFPNEGKTLPFHLDLGEDKGKEVIGQIFFQALEVVEFLHGQGHIHRDIKDDNFLIRRRLGCEYQGLQIPFLIEISLCDFGLAGYINKSCSLPQYNENRYRDTQNISKHPAACDIFSLGELLNMLVILYHFYRQQDIDSIFKAHKNDYKEEISLSQYMKADIANRPKNFMQLKNSSQYQTWLNSIPEYIPKMFANQATFL